MEHLLDFKSHTSVAGKLIHQQHKEGLEDLRNKSHSISLSFSFSCPLDLLLKPQPLMPLFTTSRKGTPNIPERTEKHKSNFQTVSAPENLKHQGKFWGCLHCVYAGLWTSPQSEEVDWFSKSLLSVDSWFPVTFCGALEQGAVPTHISWLIVFINSKLPQIHR